MRKNTALTVILYCFALVSVIFNPIRSLSSHAKAGEERQSFVHPDCPFTFDLPQTARLDKDGVKVIKWDDDGSRQIWATWEVGGIAAPGLEISLACTPQGGYKIPDGYVESICSPHNPNLLKGSHCGSAKSYEGVEVYYPRTIADAAVSYFWIYAGHKAGKGRVTLQIGYESKEKPDAKIIDTVDSIAKALFETIR